MDARVEAKLQAGLLDSDFAQGLRLGSCDGDRGFAEERAWQEGAAWAEVVLLRALVVAVA